ncbi:helix-turn-helix domain-containing protein [uncultured Methanospirillum sp.]|uniref:winged helix-turn-helix transcriptional regulator n=1 Tax=uncultured Methanospirillum sp. TaxID=262503 RepID=UPI0029C75964|nr:helix-turn-helix domain-containing protein [uncultured Methanospirillum sp.]
MRILLILLLLLICIPAQVMATRYQVSSAYDDLPDGHPGCPSRVDLIELPLWLILSQIVLLNPFLLFLKAIVALGYRRIDRSTLFDSQPRKEIFDFIRNHPGIHLRGIASGIGMELGTVRHHLDQLARFGKISKEQDDGFSRYYPMGYSSEEKQMMNAAASPACKEIVAMLCKNKSLTRLEIGCRLEISAQAAGWHLSRLLRGGVITVERTGRTLKYHLNDATLLQGSQ